MKRNKALRELSEDTLSGYEEDQHLLASSTTAIVFIALFFLLILCAFIFPAYVITIFSFIFLIGFYGAYLQAKKKCIYCGGRCDEFYIKKTLNGPRYSSLHRSFKTLQVIACRNCKKYSSTELE